MKKARNKLIAAFVVLAMCCTTFLSGLPSLDVLAAPITEKMAHLKSGAGNGNGHFSGNSEAFVLSNSTYTNENFSFKMKLGSEAGDTRFRFVTKYIDSDNWGFIAFDAKNDTSNTGEWLYQYKNGAGNEAWPKISGLPGMNIGDIVQLSGEWQDDGLHVTVENKTSGESGTAVLDNANFTDQKTKAGKIGFGGATFGSKYTDIYFNNVTVGANSLSGADFSLFNPDAVGQVWEQAVDVVVGDDGETNPPTGEGRAWWTLTGGSNNSGGHSYGNASVKAPVLLLDNDKRMEASGTLSLTVKPSDNWGVFYTYINDDRWIYVGHDPSSGWYCQYQIDGTGAYPKIEGLPTPVEGEELSMEIAHDRETLSVTVNGTKVSKSIPALLPFAETYAGQGRFGVKTNGQTTIQFADVTYNDTNCMEDEWVFCAERSGQIANKTYTQLVPLTGTVTNAESEPVSGAKVRVGASSATTDENGVYAFEGLEVGTHNMAVTKPGYQAYSEQITLTVDKENTKNVQLELKAPIDLGQYDTIESDVMKVYIGKAFPVVARYEMKSDASGETYFRGNEAELNTIWINGTEIEPTVEIAETTKDSRTYNMHVEKETINLDMQVKVSVKENDLTWKVTKIDKNEGCPKIATIDIPQLNLLSVDAVEEESVFAGAGKSTNTTSKADSYITFDEGFIPDSSDAYLYAFLSNGKLSAGLHSNSEAEGDKRVVRNNGAETMSLASAPWYYELGDKGGQARGMEYPVSELPYAKVAIAGDENKDGDIDWNDGAIAYRDIMNTPYETDVIKDMVNYRIVMNFASMVSNPYLTTADNIKKVYLATDGLPQSIMLKGYGNEGHDSANSEYADIAEREGGVEDFQNLIKIAHDYNTEIGIHVNAQEVYPEAKSFNEDMLSKPFSNGWGWIDQSHVIDKIWDLSTQARWKRFVQLYDRINNTDHLNLDFEKGEYVLDSQGTVDMSKADLKKEAESLEDNMDFIYLDVWYQNSWETRRIAEEINSLGWRFSTEFSDQGEYDSTWQHWATDASYGGAAMKGFNSDIIRFIRNDQRDSQVLNYPQYGGTADNPLLGGYRLYGFEGWGGDRDFNNYIIQTFTENLPTKFLQHYKVIDWENYGEGEVSPVGNTEKQITLANEDGDKVVVTRNEAQRSDSYIERTITLNNKKVLDDVTYLLPWTDNQDGTEKLYHWNLEGGTTQWELPDGWEGLANVVMYELSDQGRINETPVSVSGNAVTLEAKAATAYVLLKGESAKELKNSFGEYDYVKDPGFNGYASGEQLSALNWTGDITDTSVVVEKAATGDQRLAFNNPTADVEVTTTLSGLKAGTNYVAEVYVENNSDEKASIAVNTGSSEVSNYTERSILSNYVKSDQKNGTKMQRMQISFTSEGETADLTLARAAGEGSTYMDDIRIVEKTLDNFKEDGSFVQDFETVVQGLYPFVLSSAQGISDPVTHLSEKNGEFTDAGWNNRVIDDTLDGNWSVKHHAGGSDGVITGIIYQTLPQNFRFEPGKVYTVEFDYQSGPNNGYAMVVGDGTSYTRPAQEDYLPQARGTNEHVTMQVIGSGSGQTWIGLYENGSVVGNKKNGVMGEIDFVLDNLVITEDKDAVAVEISSKNLYKGETAQIYGSGLEQITWTFSDENVVVVDKDANVVKAMAAGTATVTATLPDGTEKVFEITVSDSVATDISRDEYADITSSANTEQTSGEPAGSGIASAAADGDSSTYWHSQWSGFSVSADSPAILTVDLGKEMEIGGFKFQQRPGTNNGIVWSYRYEILNENNEVVASKDSTAVSDAQRSGGAWMEEILNANQKARYIKIYVEEGQGGFAAISEVTPIRVERVTENASLEDVTVKVGETATLTPVHEEGTILKGLVWSSSDESIVTVNKLGVITAVAEGEVTITVSNAVGVIAECTVKVKSTGINYDKLQKAIEEAEKIDLQKYQDGLEKDTFKVAFEEAKALLNHASSQEEADNAAQKLTDARKALKPAEEKPDPEPEPEEDKEAPTAPKNLKAEEIEKDTVKISWDKSKDNVGVVGYYVFVNGEKILGENNEAAYVTDTQVIVKNLQPGTEYTITVQAFDKAGNTSELSNEIKVTTKENDKEGNTGDGTDKPSTDNPSTDKPSTDKPSLTPVTGDTVSMTMILIMFVLSAGAIVIVIRRKRIVR